MLARLPDDCLIYYEPVVRRRYPDLIAILPEIGVLVIIIHTGVGGGATSNGVTSQR